jgi:ribosomal protein S12 methylthiotransferase
MRGGHVSKSIEDLVTEAKNLARNGTKELILIAQDLTYYGLDIYNERKLADLLRNISDVEGIDWIRLQYAYPSQFPMDVLDVMNERENICKYLDMPLQHITDNMLKSMRRGISKRRTIELVNDIRNKVPNIALRTTLIAGYPGETEQDHEEVLKFVEEMKFERLGVFTYSHEESTHAYTLEDNVPQEIKQERADEIMALQQDISYELNQKRIGENHKVLIDRIEKDHFIGRTQFDSPEVDNEVLIEAKDEYLRIGDFVNVNITDATEFDLYGKINKV